MERDELAYCERRLNDERAQAGRATNDIAARIHARLASAYAERVAEMRDTAASQLVDPRRV